MAAPHASPAAPVRLRSSSATPARRVGGLERLGLRAAGIVDQDTDRPQPRCRLLDRPRDLLLVGDIGNHGDHLVSCGLEGTGKAEAASPFFLIKAGYCRALRRRPFDGGAADAAGTAGDQHRRIGEPGLRRRGHVVAFLARRPADWTDA